METKYELKPLDITNQKNIERAVYTIAVCLGLSGFAISSEIYKTLTASQQLLFKPIKE